MFGSKMIHFLIFITLFFFNYTFIAAQKTYPKHVFNVVEFKKEGDDDWTQAFLDAWKAACDSEWPRVTIYAPKGVYLLGHAAEFDGSSCEKDRILFLFKGSTLLASSDYNALRGEENWLKFNHVNRLTIYGGIIHGQGKKLWACKDGSDDNCPQGVTSLGIYHSNDTNILGVTFIDSQMFHCVAYGGMNTKFSGIDIFAPEDSVNTDGIHIQQSSGVTIHDSNIHTGDDCISMGPGTTNVWIENVFCGPGHGISIGSLCWSNDEEGVQNVTVKNATLSGTTNGLRIKAWSRVCTAFVRDVLYQDILMADNVENPIYITTNYCPNENCPPKGQSTVEIRNIAFRNIRGESASPIGVTIDCPGKYECQNITMDGIKLRYRGEEQISASCSHAEVFTTDDVHPILENC